MTHHRFILCLVTACLTAMPLAACAPSGLVPAPPATTTIAVPATPVVAIDSREAGDATVSFQLGLQGEGAARRILYTAGEVETLELALYWVNNNLAEPTLLRTETLDQTALAGDPSLSFEKLKRDRQYRVIATARRTIDSTATVINNVALSQLNFSIGHAQDQTATILDDLPVILLNTPPPVYTAGVALSARAGELTHPALAGTTTANGIVSATLTFEGTRARLTWTSLHAGESDYDVTLTPAADPTDVIVEAVGTDLELGTSHVRTFELGTAPYGNYKATVSLKGQPGTAFATTAALAQPISAATLTYEEGKAKVSWNSTSAAEADYDVVLYNASDAVVIEDVAFDTQKDTSHFVKLDLASHPYGTYSAKVRLKDRPATEIAAAAAAFNNTVTGATLTFDGTDAKIAWNSGIARVTDYDLEILDATDAVVASSAATAKTGKIHTATVPMGSAGTGAYRARVKAKNAPLTAAKTSTATTYTVSGAVPTVTAPALIILGSGGYYNLSFTSDATVATVFTLKILKGSYGSTPTTVTETFTITQTGPNHVYARRIDAGATMPLEPNMNYRIEIYAGTQLLGTSDTAPYALGADPIIGTCTVNPPTCEFTAPPTPATIVQ